ncbi:hypothetical protein ABN034_29190 [Actinopolymorpha sp. B11F2]|uniref:hypothetical protein n=1 Tax=Actinopolymorpha sp. B11F2 TaxID=3160862 RepID=UPI0032E3D0AB
MARRRVLLGVLGWLAVAAVAVTVGVLAISLLGRGLTDGTSQPLSSDAVARALAKASAEATSGSSSPGPEANTSPTTTGTPPPTPPAGGEAGGSTPAVTNIPSRGGTVIARCDGDQAYLTSWSPHPDFETEEAERGPDSTASVEFEGDDVKVKVMVTCVNGRPKAETETKPD